MSPNGALGRGLAAFIELNRKASRRCEPWFPHSDLDIFDLYEKTVAEYMNQKPGIVVVDVGGGKFCPFAKYRNPGFRTKIICIDVSAEEMAKNVEVDERRVEDVTHGMPCTDSEADLMVSRSVLEHLEDLCAFLIQSRRVLKEGGYCIYLFPCRFAPFALLNRALPRKVSKSLLHLAFPEKESSLGFPTFYDRCYPSAITQLLEANGFEVRSLFTSYSQSDYFETFLPAYLLSAGYEVIIRRLALKNLCAYVLVVARKLAECSQSTRDSERCAFSSAD